MRFRHELISEGTLQPDFPIPYLSWSELEDSFSNRKWLELGRSTAEETSPLAKAFTPGPRFAGHLKSFIDHMTENCTGNAEMVIVSRQISRLKELWRERRHEEISGISCHPQFIDGTLSEGWILEMPSGGSLQLLTDSEIFGWERPRPRQQPRFTSEVPETFYADLKPGDWVVHIDYGIGRFEGLVRRSLEGVEREFLAVSYDEGDQLFVPVHQADRLSRYIGPDAGDPRPTRLGTPEWANTKQRVREAVLEIAQDLLDLYAKRQVAVGHAFKTDSVWQQELEASFPYIETQDQIEAIREVKHDMENVRPMDRLLCGDVGYGKTEVALRAAFKSVMDGKQVAMLVPTTVLAQQHFDTFRRRLAAYPAEVEMLSRFRSSS